LSAGYSLTVYNRTRSKTTLLADAGARVAATPAEAVEDADIIVTIVANDEASKAVWLGDDGILVGAKSGAVAIESSTLSLEWVRELARIVHDHDLLFLDSPVGGSKDAARGRNLVLFVGGDAEVVEKARPVLDSFSANLLHMGPPGSGTAAKLTVNHMVGLQMLMLAEGLVFAENLGIDRGLYLNMVSNGALGSPFIKLKAGLLADDSYREPHFMLKWMRKDLSNILRAADEVTTPMPLASAAHEIYQMAQANGLGDQDFAAVVEQLRGG
ncbi:MAG: NAD(P)-dependent oxidoreductase, partial [Chloroflexi bacterium]|nr:NAD(P)-dependent oxidoreductase [Chloroflexota bacterium]